MERWDYRVLIMGANFDVHSFETTVDNLGQEGWELIDILTNQKVVGETGNHEVAIFKRPCSGFDCHHEPD